MDRNLIAVALTVVALGAIAAFDIIPGAGFYAGLVMAVSGGAILLVPLAAGWLPQVKPLSLPLPISASDTIIASPTPTVEGRA